MPAPKATGAKSAVEAPETEEEFAAALSALLKKGHSARTKALLKDDCDLSQHIIREAERAGLDANMLLAIYLGVIAHVLNPCTLLVSCTLLIPSCAHQKKICLRVAGTARYRQNKKLMHETFVLLWLLMLGDSGVGKSKVCCYQSLSTLPSS